MNHSTKTERVTARVHPAVKQKLERSRYNARNAIEWFVNEITDERTAMNIDEMILLQERECHINEINRIDKELEKIRTIRKEKYGGDLSELQKESYLKILSLYSEYSSAFADPYDKHKVSLEEFVKKEGIQKNIINDLPNLDCPMDEYISGLFSFYRNGRQASMTF